MRATLTKIAKALRSRRPIQALMTLVPIEVRMSVSRTRYFSLFTWGIDVRVRAHGPCLTITWPHGRYDRWRAHLSPDGTPGHPQAIRLWPPQQRHQDPLRHAVNTWSAPQ